jgi:chromosome segregation protein
MLRLKKISLVGFKTFCDRTEFAVPGSGIAVVAGPNGCGKSNILDGISWVLGEQSAKSLRGAQMHDVIFAGTTDRRPLAMAEVTLVLVGSEMYEEPLPAEWSMEDGAPNSLDWDEDETRRQRAAEGENIEAIISEAQPVFREGETWVTRRLFRSGESEYLVNGKPCRLRDLQELFLSTGLGPDTYAVIGQEQIGQLLSSKPNDRRAVIEAAAGVDELKTHRKLVEKRLNGAKDSLARVDDILEEVSRQVINLKRQAAKAERLGTVRDELHRQMRIVLASRIGLVDAEMRQLESRIAGLNDQIQRTSARIETTEAQRHTLNQQGGELERAVQEARRMANAAEVEHERATAQQDENAERLRELEAHLGESGSGLVQTQTELAAALQECEKQQASSNSEKEAFHAFQEKMAERERDARGAKDAVFAMERHVADLQRIAAQLMVRTGEIRNSTVRAQESLAMLEREAGRLESEVRELRDTLATFRAEKSKTSEQFEAAGAALKKIEREIGVLGETLHARQTDEAAVRNRANALRAEQAAALGRQHVIDAMLRDHGYATETVQKLLRTGEALKPATTLATYLEVDEQHEQIVDEFLREELNYVVVGSWSAAEAGVRLLKSSIDGRATFLVHPQPGEQSPSNGNHDLLPRPGITPLKDEIHILNGIGKSLDAALPKLRNGYIVDSSEEARDLAVEFPEAFFLTPQGECFHNATVTGGTPAREGPLALRRERLVLKERLVCIEHDLIKAEADGKTLATTIEQLSEGLTARSLARHQAETVLVNQSAVLKQLESSIGRVERELQDRTSQAKRNDEAREAKRAGIVEIFKEADELEKKCEEAGGALELQVAELAALRLAHQGLEEELATDGAEFARLTERGRGSEAALRASKEVCASLEHRLLVATDRRNASHAERVERLSNAAKLADQVRSLAVQITEAGVRREASEHTLLSLRQRLTDLESELKTERASLDRLREDRDGRSTEMARLRADLDHYSAASFANLGVDAATLQTDESILRLAADELEIAEETCSQLRFRIEQMGPVNMMALDEYKEAAVRHEFLQTQRKGLNAAIEGAQEEIREIDQVTQAKFIEALARINENFEKVFAQLFSGGHAQLRAMQAENQREAGLEIAASPPGKKLQNALLLSGGEKALTALALVVAIFQYRPSPFCVLDEVDAPLDETNIGRFADFMRSLSRETQFLVVTHSRRMMQAADMIFGITMQEPGISKVLSLRLNHSET